MANINLIGAINQLGYGHTSLNILKALSSEHNVSLWPIGEPQVANQPEADVVSTAIANGRMFDDSAPCVRIWHQNQMDQFVGHGPKVGFPIFELDEFDVLELHHLSHLDHILVTSEWAKDVIISNIKGDKRVDVVPLGVDTSVFKSGIPTRGPNRPTIFYNCGKWEVRKGHDILIEAFKKAFTPQDNVELWMMCDNPFNTPDENAYWLNKYKHDQVRIINRVESHKEVYNIMSQVDCGIFPARAEGWNLEALEILACGKHLIITDYSAHTEFCNKDNAMLIDIDQTEVAYDGKWFHGKGNWAKIGTNQIDQMVEHMRAVHQQMDVHPPINTNGVKTAEQFTWNNSANRMLEAIDV